MFKNFSWGHGVILGLGSFILFILYMVIYFGQGMKNAELVSEHYYEDEQQYQTVIDAKKRAEILPYKPVYAQTASGISIKFPTEITPTNKKASFTLFRTDDANLDIQKEVSLNVVNSFYIPAKILTPGSYTLKLKWKKDNQDYQLDYSLLWK